MHATPADCSTTAPMDDELDRARSAGLAAVAGAATLDELRAVESDVLGKRGALARTKAGLGALPPEDRRDAGRAVNEAVATVQAALDERRPVLAADARREQLAEERLDLTEALGAPHRGHAHLVTQATERLEDTFIGLGFQIAEGPEVETDWHNFEALNMPPSHPARSEWATSSSTKGPWGPRCFRTPTSPWRTAVCCPAQLPSTAPTPARSSPRQLPTRH